MAKKLEKTQKEFDRYASALDRMMIQPSSTSLIEGQLRFFEAMSHLTPKALVEQLAEQFRKEDRGGRRISDQ